MNVKRSWKDNYLTRTEVAGRWTAGRTWRREVNNAVKFLIWLRKKKRNEAKETPLKRHERNKLEQKELKAVICHSTFHSALPSPANASRPHERV